MRVGGVALLAVAVVLAGCSGGKEEFTVPQDLDSVAEVDGSAHFVPADGGEGAPEERPPEPFNLTVEVRLESGTGALVPGAAVVFDAGWGTEAARTDASGRAYGLFTRVDVIQVHVGGLEGFTTETLPNVVLGDPGETGLAVVPLYRAALPINLTADLPLAVAQPGQPAAHDVPLVFSADEAVHAAYVARLAGLDANLTWDNGPASWADLYAGISSAQGGRSMEGTDAGTQTPLDSGNVEALSVDEGQAATLADGTDDLRLRALSRTGFVTMEGLAVAFQGEARFVGSDDAIVGTL